MLHDARTLRTQVYALRPYAATNANGLEVLLMHEALSYAARTHAPRTQVYDCLGLRFSKGKTYF